MIRETRVLSSVYEKFGDVFVEIGADVETEETVVYAMIFYGTDKEKVIYEDETLEDLCVKDASLKFKLCDSYGDVSAQDICDYVTQNNFDELTEYESIKDSEDKSE